MDKHDSLDQDLKHLLQQFEDYKKYCISTESDKQKIISDLEWSHRQERLIREQLLALQKEIKCLRSMYSETCNSIAGISYLQNENSKLSMELKRKNDEKEALIVGNRENFESLKKEFSEKQDSLKKIHNEEMKNQYKLFSDEKEALLSKLCALEERCNLLENEKLAILSENRSSYMNIKLAYEGELAKLRDELNEASLKWDTQNEKFRQKWQSFQRVNFSEKQDLRKQVEDMTSKASVLEVDLQAAVKRNEALENDLKKYTKYFKSKKSAASVYDDIEEFDQPPVRQLPPAPRARASGSRARAGQRRGRGAIRGSLKPKLDLFDEDGVAGSVADVRRFEPPRPHQPPYYPSYAFDDDDVVALPNQNTLRGLAGQKSFGKSDVKKRKLFSETYDLQEIDQI